MKKKNIIKHFFKSKFLLFLSSNIAITTFAISCQDKNDNVKKYDEPTYISKSEVIAEYANDGDTFRDTEKNRYRLKGIDAEEMTVKNQDGTRYATTGKTRKWAEEATNALKEKVEGKKVTVWVAEEDKWKRKVARVFTEDGLDLSIWLVEKSLARMRYIVKGEKDVLGNKVQYGTNDIDFYNKLEQAEKNAQEKKLGIWS